MGICCRHLRAVLGIAAALFLAPAVLRAAGAEIKAGDQVKVTIGPAPVKVGDETLATIKAGTTLPAIEVKGEWVKVAVQADDKEITGWVHRRHLRPSVQSPPPSPEPKKEPTPEAPDSEDQPDDQEAKQLVEQFKRSRQANPVPPVLQGCSLAAAGQVQVEAAVVEHAGRNALTVRVVTKEPGIPADSTCMILGLSNGAKPSGVCGLMKEVGQKVGYTEMSSQVFLQKLFSCSKKEGKRIYVFSGSFSSMTPGARFDVGSIGFSGHVAVQLCARAKGSAGPYKPISNALWVKVADAKASP